jgi:hypothetical protein
MMELEFERMASVSGINDALIKSNTTCHPGCPCVPKNNAILKLPLNL